MNRLFSVSDLLCSWCWAMSPEIKAVRGRWRVAYIANGFSVALVSKADHHSVKRVGLDFDRLEQGGGCYGAAFVRLSTALFWLTSFTAAPNLVMLCWPWGNWS